MCIKAGWYVIPSYDYSGEEGNKAPRMEGKRTSYVLPDLDICRGGQRVWVEVKTKLRADYTRMTGRLEHGISLRHYEQYQRIEAESGCPVYLAIYEESTGCLLRAKLSDLSTDTRVSRMKKNGRDEGGMIFFPRTAFHISPAVMELAE